MLKESVLKELNKQIMLEFYSSNLYLQMSAWCDFKGYEGSAKFLRKHATEEMQHMQKLFDYVIGTGALPIIEGIDKPEIEYETIKDVFMQTYAHEKLITKEINEIVGLAMRERDYSTFNFLQWYVSEQHEEEKLFKSILDKIEIIGLEGSGLYLLDKEIGVMVNQVH